MAQGEVVGTMKCLNPRCNHDVTVKLSKGEKPNFICGRCGIQVFARQPLCITDLMKLAKPANDDAAAGRSNETAQPGQSNESKPDAGTFRFGFIGGK